MASQRVLRPLAACALAFHLAAGRITGFHVDDESCSGLLMNNKTEQIVKCAAFFGSLSNFSASLQPHNLRLVADAGTGWTCDQGDAGCFNLTFQGKTAPVAHHVVDLTDGVVLMDYTVNATKFVQRAESYLSYADSPGPARVRVGAAVAAWGDVPESWQTRNETELEALLSASLPSLEAHGSFAGFAVFHYALLRNSSLAHPCSGCEHQPKDLWYMDHSLILDQQRWPEWFEWAKSRRVTGLYISPHSGDQALIAVPGVEGSAQDEATFCSFAQECDAASIHIELLSGGDWAVLYDVPFATKCNDMFLNVLV